MDNIDTSEYTKIVGKVGKNLVDVVQQTGENLVETLQQHDDDYDDDYDEREKFGGKSKIVYSTENCCGCKSPRDADGRCFASCDCACNYPTGGVDLPDSAIDTSTIETTKNRIIGRPRSIKRSIAFIILLLVIVIVLMIYTNKQIEDIEDDLDSRR